jgi:hypothetical protein
MSFACALGSSRYVGRSKLQQAPTGPERPGRRLRGLFAKYLLAAIRRVHTDSGGVYGQLKVWDELRSGRVLLDSLFGPISDGLRLRLLSVRSVV